MLVPLNFIDISYIYACNLCIYVFILLPQPVLAQSQTLVGGTVSGSIYLKPSMPNQKPVLIKVS